MKQKDLKKESRQKKLEVILMFIQIWKKYEKLWDRTLKKKFYTTDEAKEKLCTSIYDSAGRISSVNI